MRTSGYQNYPRKCPQCNVSVYHNYDWEWERPDLTTNHNKVFTCKECGLKILGIEKADGGSVISLWKWHVMV